MGRVDNREQLDAVVIDENIVNAAVNDNKKRIDYVASGNETDKPSFITVSLLKDCVAKGQQEEPPHELIERVVVEHETTFLFGDTGQGKTILAVQMACLIAETGKKVLYVNFELSDQQMSMRYPGKVFPDSLYIATIDYSKMSDVTDQSHILDEIQRLAIEYGIEVVFIDNFTNLCINSKEGSEAGNIMLQLLAIRRTHDWTMVVLAHVPKRKPGDPLTLNDLAGSKLLSNLADNVVGINKSKKDKNMRYLIQLKSRSFPIELDSKNVQELVLTNSDGWLHFEYGGYSEETEHLPRSRDEKAELERDIVKELKAGLSYRDIADKLNTNSTFVWRVAKNNGFAKKSSKSSKS